MTPTGRQMNEKEEKAYWDEIGLYGAYEEKKNLFFQIPLLQRPLVVAQAKKEKKFVRRIPKVLNHRYQQLMELSRTRDCFIATVEELSQENICEYIQIQVKLA